MAFCRQTTGHHLSQCWPRSMSPYAVTTPQWILLSTECLFLAKTMKAPFCFKCRFRIGPEFGHPGTCRCPSAWRYYAISRRVQCWQQSCIHIQYFSSSLCFNESFDDHMTPFNMAGEVSRHYVYVDPAFLYRYVPVLNRRWIIYTCTCSVTYVYLILMITSEWPQALRAHGK